MGPRKVFQMELHELNNDLLEMGSIVEKQIYLSVKSLMDKDLKLSKMVIKNDDLIDDSMRKIETKCIKIIAMQQPIATDLRFIFTCINIVTDLERMADHAVDIAKITKGLENEIYDPNILDISKMAELVIQMIKDVLRAYVDRDLEKAYEIAKRDDILDEIYMDVFKDTLKQMTKDNLMIQQGTRFLFAFKYLERIGDHVTNICEWIIYIITGEHIDLND
ncbi:phosphate signaling complex protein PhoU [Clostridium botulinum]|uniref:Phosphate-specific transport system accessory protein PhoU n=1 Tax=Clostridium botulinum C/D str. DC5 TaxID=1443128 RepID=A0A0A0IP76_CLOBO|nr:phosphate signaling complex protein PhoU [Clostridium botulinum]KEI01481.1 PhoU family transcriptional regulator [Clostridium botulinum C/D str. BKT75002]KEI07815.1 PhoU family transcriptional regulator [Clostridium botulinum C/D str. BKT2873]KGM94128.1 PhoU family transcriptional regulator [Clostridium botulinum D str. CCUG 7971]KGN01286.1 PhoU family transcriptional regulator [Clostridium botulinum C/D str. DC5]KOC49581.1 PhoU family transcriptional regulator [Clostridium botulinum]